MEFVLDLKTRIRKEFEFEKLLFFIFQPNSRNWPALFLPPLPDLGPLLAAQQPPPLSSFLPRVAQLAPHPLGLLRTTRSVAQLLLRTGLLSLQRRSASARPSDARTRRSPTVTWPCSSARTRTRSCPSPLSQTPPAARTRFALTACRSHPSAPPLSFPS